MKQINQRSDANGFTCLDLIAVCAGLVLCAIVVFPALGRTRNSNALTQSMNNLRQLTSAWSMYAPDNGGRIVYSYPNFGGNTITWCAGNAAAGGGNSSYTYYGSDPTGIETGKLWPYVRTLAPYKCPDDQRLATATNVPYPFNGQPILRSYGMNCFLAGTTFGTGFDVIITNPGNADSCPYRFFIRESQISRPSQVFVFAEEDGASIDDGLFLLNMSNGRFYDLPARHHMNSYPLSFADGHIEIYRLRENASIAWQPGSNGGFTDWQTMTNVASFPTPLP